MEGGAEAFGDLSNLLPGHPGLDTNSSDPLPPAAMAEMEKMIASLTKLGVDSSNVNAASSASASTAPNDPAALTAMMAEVEKLTSMLEKMGGPQADSAAQAPSTEEMAQIMKLFQAMGNPNPAAGKP
jgi:hypothetical protein